MFFQPKKKPEPSRADLVARLDGVLADLMADMHLVALAELLEDRATAIRMRHATTASVL
jgi:hypothetical protein